MNKQTNNAQNQHFYHPHFQQHNKHLHPHFIAGIGDGKHHEYDLPDPSAAHSFIRKRDVLMQELKKQHTNGGGNTNSHRKRRYHIEGNDNLDGSETDSASARHSKHHGQGQEEEQGQQRSNSKNTEPLHHHRQRHYQQEQPNHHVYDANSANSANNANNALHSNPNINTNPNNMNGNDPLLDYSIHNENGIFVYSSFITILGILGTLMAISWIVKTDYISEMLFKFNTNILGNHNHKNSNTKNMDRKKGKLSKKKHHDFYQNLLTLPFNKFQRKMRRVDSSTMRTKKKKTDEWNDDDDDEVGSCENQRPDVVVLNNDHHPSSHTHRNAHTTSVVDSHMNPSSSYSHHSHHGFYRHETTRLSSRQPQSLFTSSSNDYDYSPDKQQPRKRYNVHQHHQLQHNNDENMVDIGAGLEGFDMATSDSESIYTTTSFQQTKFHQSTTPTATSSKKRDVNSTSSVDSVSDEEWDKASRRERCHSYVSNSSNSTHNNNNNINEGQQYSPSKRIFQEALTSYDFYESSSPTKSKYEDHEQHYPSSTSNSSCNVITNSQRSDEEMPTPRIDNVQQGHQGVKPHAYLPSSSSYSSVHVPELPDLPCLSIESNDDDGENGKPFFGRDQNANNDEDSLQLKNKPKKEMSFSRPSIKIVEPSLSSSSSSSSCNNNKNVSRSNNVIKSPAPRSISVEELKLIRMETGMVGTAKTKTKWETTMNAQDAYHEKNLLLSSPPICTSFGRQNNSTGPNDTDTPNGKTDYQMIEEGKSFLDNKNWNEDGVGGKQPKQPQQRINELVEGDEDDDGETEGANGILHKRKDLTSCSDAASSLTSPISFSELKMKDLIGGGGFGQVWAATWRGTPVAVKVLAVSHKAENIQKAILQEFAAEINMVSGMRHPNICLYIGACLEPSNRAIVTELAANGSLWDALRLPLNPPYLVSDGRTRNAWPLSLYQSISVGADMQISTIPEFGGPVPFGTSPYIPLAPEGTW